MRATLLILVSAVGATPADDRKPVAEPYYFPIKEGARWTREVTAGQTVFDVTERVTKVRAEGGRHRVTVESVEVNGRDDRRDTVYEVSATGLARVSNRAAEGAPLPLLKTGLKEGESWTADQAGPGGAVGKATYTVGKTERVVVPAGAYTAVRVDTRIDFGTRTTTMTIWYAPGVGAVKLEAVTGDRKQTTVLKSFEPGK